MGESNSEPVGRSVELRSCMPCLPTLSNLSRRFAIVCALLRQIGTANFLTRMNWNIQLLPHKYSRQSMPPCTMHSAIPSLRKRTASTWAELVGLTMSREGTAGLRLTGPFVPPFVGKALTTTTFATRTSCPEIVSSPTNGIALGMEAQTQRHKRLGKIPCDSSFTIATRPIAVTAFLSRMPSLSGCESLKYLRALASPLPDHLVSNLHKGTPTTCLPALTCR